MKNTSLLQWYVMALMLETMGIVKGFIFVVSLAVIHTMLNKWLGD